MKHFPVMLPEVLAALQPAIVTLSGWTVIPMLRRVQRSWRQATSAASN